MTSLSSPSPSLPSGLPGPISSHLTLPGLVGCGQRNEPPLHESWEAWELSSARVGPPTTLCCHTPKAGTWHHQPLEPPGAVVTPAVTGAAIRKPLGSWSSGWQQGYVQAIFSPDAWAALYPLSPYHTRTAFPLSHLWPCNPTPSILPTLLHQGQVEPWPSYGPWSPHPVSPSFGTIGISVYT